MIMLLVALCLAQPTRPAVPAPEPPTLARARAGNALIPAGVGTVGASTVLLFAFRGTRPGVWGTGLGLGMATTVTGVGLTAVSQERAAADLRAREHPVDRTLLRTGHALAGTGIATVFAGTAMLVSDMDVGLHVGVAGLGLTALSTVPYAWHTHRLADGYRDLEAAQVSPLWDPDTQAAGVRLSVRL